MVNYTVGLAWPALPQTHLYNFVGGFKFERKARFQRWEEEKDESATEEGKGEIENERKKDGEKKGGEAERGDDRQGFARDGVS